MAAAMRNVFCQNLALYALRQHGLLGSRLAVCTSTNQHRCMSLTSKELTESAKGMKISHAMKIYLEKLQEHENFVADATADYELGKRHLANIMGEDPDTFDQEDIDKAIRYLFPSGLYDRKARPQMKHPDVFIPKTFVAQFDVHGRPLHSMYYTAKPMFYQLMYDTAKVLEKLKKLDDESVAKKLPPPRPLFIVDSSWVGRKNIEKMAGEKISDNDYEKLMKILNRIIKEPQAVTEQDFIMQFRVKMGQKHLQTNEDSVTLFEEDGKMYQKAIGYRKKATAKVKVYLAGKGNVDINGKDMIDYFPCLTDRQQLLFPLQLVGMLNTVDIKAEVQGGGSSGQAGALRHAISLALQSIVDNDTRTKMRLVGLLTRDVRTKERKKFGQARARKKYTWKKR